MKKILLSIIATLFFTAANANELENTLNKVYDKGSDAAENYIK